MFIANSSRCYDVVYGHAALLAMCIHEATLPYEMLLLVAHKNVVVAVERAENCFRCATLKLAGLE